MLRVCDVMTSNVLTVEPDMTLREVVELFATNHVSGAPVVAGGRTLGVISAADIMSAGAEAPRPAPVRAANGEDDVDWLDDREAGADEETSSAFYETGGDELPSRLGEEEWLDRFTVGELMTRQLCALPPDASISEAANYMLWANVHRILVMEREQLLGILSTSDIVRAVAQRRI